MRHQLISHFLGPETRNALLEYVLKNEQRFEATGIGTDNVVKDEVRRSRKLLDLGDFRQVIQERVKALIPDAIEKLRLNQFHPDDFEMEVVAHEDGAFYRRHIDLFTDMHRQGIHSDRLLTVVYYFYREPKAFSGGELRLHAIPGPAADQEPIDVAPLQDTAVAFSSWAPHEVMPVSCPSKRFHDARFAVNCWVLRAKTVAAPVRANAQESA